MRLLPSESFVVKTRIGSERVANRFARATEDSFCSGNRESKPSFIGRVNQEGFRIFPATVRGHAFPLLAVGHFQPTITGTRIQVKLIAKRFVVFLSACYALIFLGLTLFLLLSPLPYYSLISIGLLLSMPFLAHISFRQHAPGVKSAIEELIKECEVESA